jgi:pyruvate,water dikinase
VFYLSFEELLDAVERGQRVDQMLLDRRRARQAQWRMALPPARLGGNEAASDGAVLRGIAGSPGVYHGRARIIATLEAAGTLEPGDILVCAATAPEWTPYFGVIGALVTGAGGALTHGAVVAREFGIPAVVGVSSAMLLIADGAKLTVDGSNGTVTIEE